MPTKVNVMLLGISATLVSLFARHRHEYQLQQYIGDETSISVVGSQPPQIVIIAGDNLPLCQYIRQVWPTIPLIMVSENTQERSVIRALDLGADDYVRIPFGEQEFFARIHALLRRISATKPRDIRSHPNRLTSWDGKIALHVDEHRCFCSDRPVHLTITEFELLRTMMKHQGTILTHRFLLQRVWGSQYSQQCDYLRVYMRQLRLKLEIDPSRPQYIVTATRVGYIFQNIPS